MQTIIAKTMAAPVSADSPEPADGLLALIAAVLFAAAVAAFGLWLRYGRLSGALRSVGRTSNAPTPRLPRFTDTD